MSITHCTKCGGVTEGFLGLPPKGTRFCDCKKTKSFDERVEQLVSLKFSQMLVDDKPDKQGWTMAKVITNSLLALVREEVLGCLPETKMLITEACEEYNQAIIDMRQSIAEHFGGEK